MGDRRLAPFVVICLVSFLSPPPAAARPADEPPGDRFACTGVDAATGAPLSGRAVAPATIALCDTAQVTTRWRAACGPPPLSVVAVVDRSGSMIGPPIAAARAAAAALVDALDLPANGDTHAALVSHGDPATVDAPLGRDAAALHAAIDRLDVPGPDAFDNLPGALDAARQLLTAARRPGDPRAVDVAVVLSDGGQTYAAPQVLAAGARARDAGILVVPVCVANALADCGMMRELAGRADLAFEVEDTGGLAALFARIAQEARDVVIQELVVEETLPDGLALVPGSTVPVPEIGGGGRRLTWRLGFVPHSGVTITFGVTPDRVGPFTLAAPRATFRDPAGSDVTLAVPAAALAVAGTCGAPTPTEPPVPATSTPTASPAPSATPPTTAPPRAVHLPILFRDHCLVRDRPADVVLLIDASLSMGEPTGSGRSKLAAAQDGARQFVARMRPADQTAVVTFNSVVTGLAELTGDRTALAAAIDRIALAPGTRIDVALYAAVAELAGPRRRPDARAVIVLLTDGRPSETTPPAVRAAAEAARGAGATIFAIGVGPAVDAELLVAVAGTSGRYFPAGDGEALAEIYRQISGWIPCR